MTNAITATYQVTGMTCGHCVSAVRDEITALHGVIGADVQLAAGGVSRLTVTSTAPLSGEQIAAALDEAGDYHLAPGTESP
jgi:copper chaperone CopZ